MSLPKADVEIGAVRPNELESLLEVICETFELPLEPAREVFYGDPYLNLENKRVLRVGGRIVSCLTVSDRQVWLGNKTVRVGGIAGVATRPEERGKGYASLLISDTLGFLQAQGYALSALVPYSSHFYRRLGYEICGNACRYLTAPSFLPSSSEVRAVRPARSDDAEALSALYTKSAAGKTFYGVRDERRWQFLLENVKDCHVAVEQNSEISGYLLSDLRQNPPAFEGDLPMPTLRVLELTAATPAARRGLLAHLAAQHHAGMVEFCTHWQDLAELGFLHLVGTGIGEEILANIEVIPMLMARIVHFPLLLESILSPSHFVGDLRLELRDTTRNSPPESYTLTPTGNTSTVRPSIAGDLRLPCLSGDLRGWAQVAVGFKSADDAVAEGLLHASHPSARECGAALFPSRSPFLPAPDHF